jgi:hypothetical protein
MKSKLKSLPIWISEHWRGLLVAIIIAVLSVVTLSLQISTLIDGYNKYEAITLLHLEGFPNPFERMINAPYLIPAYILGNAIDNMLIGARIVSVLYALIATAAIFSVIKKWFSIQYAAVASLLFITSSWVLAISHQASSFILLAVAPLLIIAALTGFIKSKRIFLSFMLLIGSLAFSAYIPFMFWPILVTSLTLSIVYKNKLSQISKKQIIIASSVYFVLLLPLLISILQYPGQLKEIIGIPLQWPSIQEYASNFIWQFSTIFIYSPPFPELYISPIPLLDVFLSAMTILGIYHFVKYMPKRRKIAIGSLVLVLALVIPLWDPFQIPLTLYIPFIFIFIISGIFELLRQWFSYFPRNPFAKNIAVLVVAALIGLSTFYNLQKFYVAWPNSPETKSVYMVQSNK